MDEIVNLVRKAQNNDEGAMRELLDRFAPLIHKCYWRIHTRAEDNLQDLYEKFIRIVKCSIDFSKMREANDAVMVGYISKSLHNHGIELSKQNEAINKREALIEDAGYFADTADERADSRINAISIADLLKLALKGSEYNYVYYRVILGYTPGEIAVACGVTRQAVSQGLVKALEKLKKFLLKE